MAGQATAAAEANKKKIKLKKKPFMKEMISDVN